MVRSRTPFEVLGISPDAEIEVVQAAYRAMARKYHPDANPGKSSEELTRRMSELNTAKAELDQDLEGCRRRAKVARAPEPPQAKSSSTSPKPPRPSSVRHGHAAQPDAYVNLSCRVLTLPAERGARATFQAEVAGAAVGSIKAKLPRAEDLIDVKRGAERLGEAHFEVVVIRELTTAESDGAVIELQVVAPGSMGTKVWVSLSPVTAEVLAQKYDTSRRAPPRHVDIGAKMVYGKHKGRRFREIAVEEPGYLEWMLREGAGSVTERACAEAALAQLAGGTYLPVTNGRQAQPGRLPAGQNHSPTDYFEESYPGQTETPLGLPDPNRPGGLLGVIRRLLGG